jgi:hypothetical protein
MMLLCWHYVKIRGEQIMIDIIEDLLALNYATTRLLDGEALP